MTYMMQWCDKTKSLLGLWEVYKDRRVVGQHATAEGDALRSRGCELQQRCVVLSPKSGELREDNLPTERGADQLQCGYRKNSLDARRNCMCLTLILMLKHVEFNPLTPPPNPYRGPTQGRQQGRQLTWPGSTSGEGTVGMVSVSELALDRTRFINIRRRGDGIYPSLHNEQIHLHIRSTRLAPPSETRWTAIGARSKQQQPALVSQLRAMAK